MVEQYKAIYNAVVSIQKDKGLHFEDGIKVDLSSDERKTLIQVIANGLEAGEIMMSDSARTTHNTPKKLYNYAAGLVSDRLRKDKRINGNEKYQTQKPGSRAGAGDAIIKELREYKKTHCVTPEQIAEVDEGIAKRLEEIRQEKLESTSINMDLVNSYLDKVRNK